MWQLHEITWLLIIIMTILISLNDEVLTKRSVSDVKKSNHKETNKSNHKDTNKSNHKDRNKSNENKEQIQHSKQSKKSHGKQHSSLKKGHPGNHTTKVSRKQGLSISKALQLERCPPTRIIGGGYLDEGQLPFAAIYYICPKPHSDPVSTKDCLQWCGGSIISKLHIITAAHCLTDRRNNNTHVPPSKILVRVGFHDLRKPEVNGTTIEVSATFLHKDYAVSPVINDIAIIKLKHEITFTKLIQPICINGIHYTYHNLSSVLLSGWGKYTQDSENSKQLKYAKLTAYSYPKCQISESQSLLEFCADSASMEDGVACNGDSGSGLIYSIGNSPVNLLLGIMSTAGNLVNNTLICGLYPMHFMNVSGYAQWINDHVAK